MKRLSEQTTKERFRNTGFLYTKVGPYKISVMRTSSVTGGGIIEVTEGHKTIETKKSRCPVATFKSLVSKYS